MRSLSLCYLTVIGAVACCGPAAALDTPAGGAWAVKGKVGAFAFTITCRFEQQGAHLRGACYDGGTHKEHPLTAGSAADGKVEWTYQSSFMTRAFDVTYSGVLDAAGIRGTITVPGHTGDFTASRP